MTDTAELGQSIEGKQHRNELEADLKHRLTQMFALLEPTLVAAAVALRVMEKRSRLERDRRTAIGFSALELVRAQELESYGRKWVTA